MSTRQPAISDILWPVSLPTCVRRLNRTEEGMKGGGEVSDSLSPWGAVNWWQRQKPNKVYPSMDPSTDWDENYIYSLSDTGDP
jgi:hypothetical protein